MHSGTTGSVKVYRGFESALNFLRTRNWIPYQWHTNLVNYYLDLNLPFHVLNTISIIGLYIDGKNIFKNAQHLCRTTDLLRFDAAMHILRSVGSAFENIAGTLYGLEGLQVAAKLDNWNYHLLATAVRTSTAAANTFLALGTLLSITDIVIHARKWKKTDEYIKDFIENSGYREDGNYHKRSFQQFLTYLQLKDSKELKHQFLVNGKLLKAKLLTLCLDVESRRDDQLTSIMNKLKERLEASKTTYKVALISDASSLLSKALIISGLFHPLGYFLLGVFTLGRFTVFVQRKISAYRFENQIGLIVKPHEIAVHESQFTCITKVKDFAVWFFGFHKYIPMPKIPKFHFYKNKTPILPV